MSSRMGRAQQLAAARILLIEDEPLIALDCDLILRKFGVAEIVLAANLPEAEAAIARGGFDAAILDVALGGGTSFSLARRLLEARVPVGFLSGYRQDFVPAHMRSCPFLAKPFNSDQLHELLLAILCSLPT